MGVALAVLPPHGEYQALVTCGLNGAVDTENFGTTAICAIELTATTGSMPPSVRWHLLQIAA